MTVTNRGRLGHYAPDPRRHQERPRLQRSIRPGESKTREFSPGPGTYTMYCVLANHEELGLHGTLTVG